MTDLTKEERSYLLKLLGGPLDMATRTLGQGMTAQGVIVLREKLSEGVSNRAFNPSVEGDG
jgi:hypothetical protein